MFGKPKAPPAISDSEMYLVWYKIMYLEKIINADKSMWHETKVKIRDSIKKTLRLEEE